MLLLAMCLQTSMHRDFCILGSLNGAWFCEIVEAPWSMEPMHFKFSGLFYCFLFFLLPAWNCLNWPKCQVMGQRSMKVKRCLSPPYHFTQWFLNHLPRPILFSPSPPNLLLFSTQVHYQVTLRIKFFWFSLLQYHHRSGGQFGEETVTHH